MLSLYIFYPLFVDNSKSTNLFIVGNDEFGKYACHVSLYIGQATRKYSDSTKLRENEIQFLSDLFTPWNLPVSMATFWPKF